MSVRITKISAGQGAVHTPVVVDTVYRPDPQQFNAIEQDEEDEKKKPSGTRGGNLCGELASAVLGQKWRRRNRLRTLIDK